MDTRETRQQGENTTNVVVDENGNISAPNPFAKSPLSSYSLQPKVVPNYVLDKLASAYYREEQRARPEAAAAGSGGSHRNNSDEQYASFMNDPFIRTVDNNWANFLNTVKQPTEFTPDRLSKTESFSDFPDYAGPWGGDERLRAQFVGVGANDSDAGTEPKRGVWAWLVPGKKLIVADDDPRVRSKAGYWMSDEKRKDLVPTMRRIFVQNPLVPLLLRILILMFSAGALALAASIYVYSKRKYDDATLEQQPSTIFAIVVQSFAIVYIVYIAYDEYSGKPLGLRNPLGKMKLIMLDLLFIMCSSANMSLTFDSLFDEKGVCKIDPSDLGQRIHPTVAFLCRRQRALASFLLLVLCLWVLTFTISIIRVVDRVSVGPRSD